MRNEQTFNLQPFEPIAGYDLAVQAQMACLPQQQLQLIFTLNDPESRVNWASPAPFPVRQDFLWEQTCFEAFVRPSGLQAYTELNFTPRNHWAAYRFDSYRTPSRTPPVHEDRVWIHKSEVHHHQLRFVFDLSQLYAPGQMLNIGLCAVLNHPPHQFKTYWAMSHATSSEPDFHRTACWAGRIQLWQ